MALLSSPRTPPGYVLCRTRRPLSDPFVAQHMSIAASSTCTQMAMRNYMRDGTLPAAGTVCEVESTFFGTTDSSDSTSGNSTTA